MEHFRIENLTFSYPNQKKKTLEKVSLTVNKGEYVVLCGQSGSGKTTLLRHLKSVLTPHGVYSGSVYFDGSPLETISQKEQSAKIGFVMQNPDDQIVTDKVWHELAFGLECLGTDQNTMRLRVAEMASYFGIQNWFHKDVSELSGGQKQLLNLASIMAMQPEVLILDEPTSQLDPIAASDFLNTVRKINIELGTTVIITEHRLEDIFPYADRIIIMEKGKVIANNHPRAIGHKLWQEKNEMFAALPTPVRVFYESGAEGECPLTVREGRKWLTESFVNHEVKISSPAERLEPENMELAVRIRDGWMRYERNSHDVLKGISLNVACGSIHAIVGGNGSGKSTTLKSICGINKLYQGKVEIFGKSLKAYKAGTLYDGCLAMLPQDPKSLFVKQRVWDELREMSSDEDQISNVSKICEIENLMESHPYDLSGGEQQRAGLAKVLLTRPRLLLLDEPTKALDNFFKLKLARILRSLAERGMTIVMVSHDVEFCAEHADCVSMLFDGQIVTTQNPQKFFGQNSFYTTAANRMSRCVFQNAVNVQDVVSLYRMNMGVDNE